MWVRSIVEKLRNLLYNNEVRLLIYKNFYKSRCLLILNATMYVLHKGYQ